MGRPTEQFEAWIIGTHKLTNEAKIHGALMDKGEVLLHNVTRDTWRAVTESYFDSMFEWVA